MWAEVLLPLPVDKPFTYKVPERMIAGIAVGHRVLVPFHVRTLKGVVLRLIEKSPEGRDASAYKEVIAVLDPETPVSGSLLELTRWIAQTYACSWGETLSVIFSAGESKRKKAAPAVPAVAEPVQDEAPPPLPSALVLTEEQKKVLEPVLRAVRERRSEVFLLFGVTSSGKTEVYLRAIEEAVASGAPRQALFLVPEISLCQPFYDILKKRFGGQVGVWHSQIGLRDRKEMARRIRSGDIRVVVGARSALFAPFKDLGVVIVDEEHDASYKQQEKPRYHAREAAVRLSRMTGAVVLLGSATPSLESFHKARLGEYRLLQLTQRVSDHALPEVLFVPASSRGKFFSSLSPELVAAVHQALSRREQVILALNRRGYSTYQLCSACGFIWKCRDCKLPYVHHKSGDAGSETDELRCHYCSRVRPLARQCEACRSVALVLGGQGTQKVVQEIKKIFPYARVLRLDRDVSRKNAAYARTYHSFKEESADILVGTQMVTQGFDFPRVTLVGILDADTALHQADFRAGERTFQWLCQAAGRAGRSAMGGKVWVQTSVPRNYALESAARHDYVSFFDQEMEFRRQLFYPPFSRLVLFRMESKAKKDKVPQEAERLAEHLRRALFSSGLGGLQSAAAAGGAPSGEAGIQILGPGPSAKEQLRKWLRWQILVKCGGEESLLKTIAAGRAFTPKSGFRMALDVDPYDMV